MAATDGVATSCRRAHSEPARAGAPRPGPRPRPDRARGGTRPTTAGAKRPGWQTPRRVRRSEPALRQGRQRLPLLGGPVAQPVRSTPPGPIRIGLGVRQGLDGPAHPDLLAQRPPVETERGVRMGVDMLSLRALAFRQRHRPAQLEPPDVHHPGRRLAVEIHGAERGRVRVGRLGLARLLSGRLHRDHRSGVIDHVATCRHGARCRRSRLGSRLLGLPQGGGREPQGALRYPPSDRPDPHAATHNASTVSAKRHARCPGRSSRFGISRL